LILKLLPPFPFDFLSGGVFSYLDSMGVAYSAVRTLSEVSPIEVECDMTQEKFDSLLADYENKTKKVSVYTPDSKGVLQEVKTLPREGQK